MAVSDDIFYFDEHKDQVFYDNEDPIFYDTETCGFYGMAVLVQYAIGDGPVNLYSIWKEPVINTLLLIEGFMNHKGGVIGFNLSFDHFHLCKLYTVFSLIPKSKQGKNPEDMIDLIGELEPQGRFGPALKPVKCVDLMMHARRGPYQSTMDRSDIRLRRIPSVIAEDLAQVLTEKIILDDVLFARKKDPKERWKIYDVTDEDGEVVPDFKDICLKFAPSSALKALVKTAGVGKEDRLLFKDVLVDRRYMPIEYGFAPWASAHDGAKPGDWKSTWPMVIQYHIDHWHYRRGPRLYAEDDVHDTRNLWKHFHESGIIMQFGAPKFNDDDSVLACMVATVRWRGFPIDVEGVQAVRDQAQIQKDKAPHNFNSTEKARKYLSQVLDPVVTMILTDEHTGKLSTQKASLLELAKQKEEIVCDECFGEGLDWEQNPCTSCSGEGTIVQTEKKNQCDICTKYDDGDVTYDNLCIHCNGKGHYAESKGPLFDFEVPHPAAQRAQEILDFRNAGKEIELYDKLLRAGRFHASFKVIGTLSGRMAGADKLNAQGIKNETYVRNKFPLADDGWILCGGDYDGFEVALMEAAYSDPTLRKDLLSGKKMHGLFGMHLFPGHSYEEICATKELPGALNLYGRSKTGVFAVAYGGDEGTLSKKVGIEQETAMDAYQSWCNRYIVWGEKRQELFNQFCSMRQPGGIGSRVEWHEPSDRIVSMFGFPRYFTMEMDICKVLFDIGEKPPARWAEHKVKVTRRDREQSAAGACRSALMGAAFGVQSSAMRAAANHVIQSSGATITKVVQAGIWNKFQPCGIHEFIVMPLNIHDEILSPTRPDKCEAVREYVNDTNNAIRDEKVPMLGMLWKIGIPSWADKDSILVRYKGQSWKTLKYHDNGDLTIARAGKDIVIPKSELDPLDVIIEGVRYAITTYDDDHDRVCVKGPDDYKWYKQEEFEWV